MQLNLKIDRINASEKDLFFTEYFNKQKPVIIQGLVNTTPAANKWNLDYLKSRIGEIEVDVFDNTIKKTTAYTGGDYKMKFSEFVDHIRRNEECNIRLFLFNAFKYCSDFKKEFPCPAIFKGVLDKVGFMFFGGKNTHVRMHFDIDMSNVLHTQFEGKKRVLLISQEYNDLLYKTPFNTYSIADFQNIDESKFPGLKYVKGYDIILNPGESLFMPGGYWHYMIYLEGSFAVAYRKIAYGVKNTLTGINYLTLKLWTDKLLTFVLGKKWTVYKSQIAYQRAETAIKKIENEGEGIVIS
jgi:hypothetical protein